MNIVLVVLQLSYANSRAPNEDIMHSSKNQEVVRFYDTVEYFQPSFVLMENVPVSQMKYFQHRSMKFIVGTCQRHHNYLVFPCEPMCNCSGL